MPGPVSNGVRQNPTGELTKQSIKPNGKTSSDYSSGKHSRHESNKARCALRNSAGKLKGAHSCYIHPEK